MLSALHTTELPRRKGRRARPRLAEGRQAGHKARHRSAGGKWQQPYYASGEARGATCGAIWLGARSGLGPMDFFLPCLVLAHSAHWGWRSLLVGGPIRPFCSALLACCLWEGKQTTRWQPWQCCGRSCSGFLGPMRASESRRGRAVSDLHDWGAGQCLLGFQKTL